MAAVDQLEEFYGSFPVGTVESKVVLLADFYSRFQFAATSATTSRRLRGEDLHHFFLAVSPFLHLRAAQLRKHNPDLNIWEGIGIGHSEVKHCSFLRWLLDCGADHRQGSLFLKCLCGAIGFTEILPAVALCEYRTTKEECGADLGRTDIYIKSRHFLLVIEAKINAAEQTDQIGRYRRILARDGGALAIPRERQAVVFLTKSGAKPETGTADFAIRWVHIAEAADLFCQSCENRLLGNLVNQYAAFLRALA